MSLYDEFKAAGCRIGSHESDMYVRADDKPPRETAESLREMFGLPGVHYAAKDETSCAS